MTEDLTKWDEVLEWNIVKFLNRLVYVQDKQKLIARKNRELQAKMKHGG